MGDTLRCQREVTPIVALCHGSGSQQLSRPSLERKMGTETLTISQLAACAVLFSVGTLGVRETGPQDTGHRRKTGRWDEREKDAQDKSARAERGCADGTFPHLLSFPFPRARRPFIQAREPNWLRRKVGHRRFLDLG